MVSPNINSYPIFAAYWVIQTGGLFIRVIRLTEIWWLIRLRLNDILKRVFWYITCTPKSLQKRDYFPEFPALGLLNPERKNYLYYVCYGLYFVVVSQMV